MVFMSILGYARKLVEGRVSHGDTVIDATVGKGIDTVFLAQLVGQDGTVYGFDIQSMALEKTYERLAQKNIGLATVKLTLLNHAEMPQVIPAKNHGQVSAVMFNLGYLPGSDRNIITKPQSTIPALDAAVHLLKVGGIVTVIIYPGHEGGEEEADAVIAWASQLPQQNYQVLCYRFLNQKNHPPFLIAVEKSNQPNPDGTLYH